MADRKEYFKAYQKANKEKLKLFNKLYYLKNKESRLQKAKERYKLKSIAGNSLFPFAKSRAKRGQNSVRRSRSIYNIMCERRRDESELVRPLASVKLDKRKCEFACEGKFFRRPLPILTTQTLSRIFFPETPLYSSGILVLFS